MVYRPLAAGAVLALAGIVPAPAAAFQVSRVVAETCAATSLTNEFEFGCNPASQSVTYTPGQLPRPADPDTTAADLRRSAGAWQSLAGHGSVSAEAIRAGVAAPLDELAGGGTSSLEITIASNGGPAEPVTLGFDIASAALLLNVSAWAAAPGDDIPIAEVRVLLNCTGCDAGSAWFYQAQFGTYGGGVLIGFQDSLDFYDPQGIGKPTWNVVNSQPGSASAVLAAPFQPTLTLGTLEPGETFVVDYTVHARAYVGVYDSSLAQQPPPDEPKVTARAHLEDPFGLPGDSTPPPFADHLFVNDVPLSILVPEPGPLWLALAASATLAGVALVRRPRAS